MGKRSIPCIGNLCFYDHPIGDGNVKGTDWNHLFALSGICIVLQLSDRKDHFFEITTAYPIPDFDEVDEILMPWMNTRLQE